MVSIATFISLALLTPTTWVSGFPSTAPETLPKQFIEITNPMDMAATNKLPASFVRGWPTWVLDLDGKITKIPDDEGFVPPDSVDELFQPVDLRRPEMRLALGAHVRAGNVRHIMPALDICYEGGLHRNRGMCSVARAYGWIDFNIAMLDEWGRFQLKAGVKAQDETEYQPLGDVLTGKPIADGVERLLLAMAESAPDELGDGSHIIHILLDQNRQRAIELPKSGTSLRVALDDDDYLVNTDDASGMLEVTIQNTMAGSESQYLPDAYRPLYEDTAFRNPRYDKFKKKKASKTEL